MRNTIAVSLWILCVLSVHAAEVSGKENNSAERKIVNTKPHDKVDHTFSFLSLNQHTFSKLHIHRQSQRAGKGKDRHARRLAEQAIRTTQRNNANIKKNNKQLKQQSQTLKEHKKDLVEHEKRLDNLHRRSFEVIKALKMSHVEATGIKNNIRSTAKNANNIMKDIKSSRTQSEEVKSLAAGQIAKLRRMWSSEDIRIKYAKLRRYRERADANANKGYCENEKHGHVSIFSAVPLNEEIDSKSCINRNRDELIEAFCNFRQSFFDVYSNDMGFKNGQHYWPNICCKPFGESKEKDQCEDPSGKIIREKIVPFALARGGEVTFSTLYGEVKDVMESNGYLEQGFGKLMDDIGCAKERLYIRNIEDDLAHFKKHKRWNPKSVIFSNIKYSTKMLTRWKNENKISFPTYHNVKGYSFTSSRPIFEALKTPRDFTELLGSKTFNNFVTWYLNTQLRSAQGKLKKKCLYLKYGIPLKDIDAMKKTIRGVFAQKSLLCGPKTFFAPPREETTMCELFAPYKHMFTAFRLGFERMFVQNAMQAVDDNSFLQLMETRQSVENGDSVSKSQQNMGYLLKRKVKLLHEPRAGVPEEDDTSPISAPGTESTKSPKKAKVQEALARRSLIVKQEVKSAELKNALHPKARVSYRGSKSTCPKVTGANQKNLDNFKSMFCPPLTHLDLVNEQFDNFAILYIQDDINPREKKLFQRLKQQIKYSIDNDGGCATPLFSPRDISLQRVKGTWVALVKLDSKSKTGYLQNEVANCKNLDYMPQNIIKVNVLQTVKKYCIRHVSCGDNDRRRRRLFHSLECGPQKYFCGYKDIPVPHYHTKQPLEYTITMTGATFQLEYHTKTDKRRRLLTKRWSNC